MKCDSERKINSINVTHLMITMMMMMTIAIWNSHIAHIHLFIFTNDKKKLYFWTFGLHLVWNKNRNKFLDIIILMVVHSLTDSFVFFLFFCFFLYCPIGVGGILVSINRIRREREREEYQSIIICFKFVY